MTVVQATFARLAIAIFGVLLLSNLAFAAARPPTHPVIIVPGIIGSKICETQGSHRQIWPSNTASGVPDLSALRLSLNDADAGVGQAPCGMLDKFETFYGIIDIGLYGGLKDFVTKDLKYGTERVVVFDYDWRLSNFVNARRLADLVARLRVQSPDGKVDIVAHSMGGLVTRIFLQRMDGAKDVANVVFLGVPHRLAVQALKSGVFGWRNLQNTTGTCSKENLSLFDRVIGFVSDFAGSVATSDAGEEEKIRESTFSWRSYFELVPLDDCCNLFDGKKLGNKVPLGDLGTWEKLPWLPARYRNANGLTSEFKAFLQQNLQRSKDLAVLLNEPLPAGPRYTFVASQEHSTTARALLNQDLKITNFLADCGDGAVTAVSASNGDLVHARYSSSPHATIFETARAKEYIAVGLNLLDEADIQHAPPPIRPLEYYQRCTDKPALTQQQADAVREATRFYVRDAAGAEVCVSNVAMTANPTLLKTGEKLTVSVEFVGFASLLRRDLRPTLLVLDGNGTKVSELSAIDSTIYSLNGVAHLDFKYELTPAIPGPIRLSLYAPGIADEPETSRFATTIMVTPAIQ